MKNEWKVVGESVDAHGIKHVYLRDEMKSTEAKPGMIWDIKCDDCKKTIRKTENVRESYAGGRCDDCKKKIAGDRL